MRRVIARYFKKCLYRAKNKYCSVILCVVKNIPLKKRAVHMPRALSVGYFACAQYDVLFIPYRHFVPLPPKEEAKLHVILSMSSEQTCLQGFVSEDIHKAQAFCKNAKR